MKKRPLDLLMALSAVAVAVFLMWTSVTSAPALWRDEINSVNTVLAPSLSELCRRSQFESFPLLFTVLLRGWIAIAGTTDVAFRAFGFLCGLTMPAALWFSARRFGRTVPVLALSLVAVNPEILRWGTTVRAWSLGASLTMVLVPLMWEAMVTPSPRRFATAAVVATLAVQCLFQNSIFVAAIVAGCAIAAFRHMNRSKVMIPVAIGVVAMISLLPYAGVFQRRAQWSGLSAGNASLGVLAGHVWDVLNSSGTIVALGWLALGGAAVVAMFVATRSKQTFERSTIIAAVVTLVVSIAGLLALYLALGYPTQPWYYLGLVTLSAMTAEVAVRSRWSGARVRLGLAAAAVLVLVSGFDSAWAVVSEPLTNIDQLATRLDSGVSSGDLVVVIPWFFGVSLSRYYRGDAIVETVPPLDDFTLHRYDLLKARMLDPDPMAPLIDRVKTVLQHGHRVWVVGSFVANPPGSPPVAPLPLPPLPDSRWSSGPYEMYWAYAIGDVIRDHAVTGQIVSLPVAGGRLENPGLWVFSAWH